MKHDAPLLDGPSDDAARAGDDEALAPIGRIGLPTVATTPRDWHERGIASEQAGDLHRASECYAEALLRGGPDAAICFDLASVLSALGHPWRAIERYRQVIELNPTRADAWNNLGDLLIEVGQLPAAISSFRRAVELAPDDAAAHYNLADALEQHGELAAARPHWAAYLHSSPPLDDRTRYARGRLEQPIDGVAP